MWCSPYRLGGDIFHPKSHWIPDYQYPEIQLKVIQPFSHPTFYEKALPRGPHSHILMTGGGGRMILLSLKFWPKVIFWVYERRWDFFWLRKKQSDFWGLRKKVLRDFFGYAKNSSDFIWQTNSEVVISLGIKYEPLSDPPTLVVKICEWAPWELSLLVHRIAHKTIVTSKQYQFYALSKETWNHLSFLKQLSLLELLHGLNKQKVVLSRRVTPASW